MGRKRKPEVPGQPTLFDECPPEPMKKCGHCKKVRPVSLFRRNSRQPDGRERNCKKCGREIPKKEWLKEYRKRYKADGRLRAYRDKTREKLRIMMLRRNYGIGIEEYERMHKAQSGLCAICGEPEKTTDGRSGRQKWLAVDHHHDSGKVRGLLCGHCNSGIGHFRDRIELLEKAIAYLNLHRQR